MENPKPKGHGVFFRAVAWSVIITFSWQQLVYAGVGDVQRRQRERLYERRGSTAIDFLRKVKQQQESIERRMLLEKSRRSVDKTVFETKTNIQGHFFAQYNQIASLLRQIDVARNLAYRASKTYVLFPPDEDGIQKRMEFYRGNVIAIWNERVTEAGNVYYRDTYDMQYHPDTNLLIEYTSKTVDAYGVTTEIHWYGAQYTADSKWYADDDTNARKALLDYKVDVKVYGGAEDEIIEIEGLTREIKEHEYYESGEFAGMLSSYTEEAYDENGVLIEKRYVSMIEYDEEGNQTSYYQVITNEYDEIQDEGFVYLADTGIQASAVSVVIKNLIFGDNGEPHSFTEEYRDEHLTVIQTRVRSSMEYSNGDLISFHELLYKGELDPLNKITANIIYEGNFEVDSVTVVTDNPVRKNMVATPGVGGVIDAQGRALQITINETRFINGDLAGDTSLITNQDGSTDVVTSIFDQNENIIRQERRRTFADGSIHITIIVNTFDSRGNLTDSNRTTTKHYVNGITSSAIYETERLYDTANNLIYLRHRSTKDDDSWTQRELRREYTDGNITSDISQRTEHNGLAGTDYILKNFTMSTREYDTSAEPKLISRRTTRIKEDGSVDDYFYTYVYDDSDSLIDRITVRNSYKQSSQLIDHLDASASSLLPSNFSFIIQVEGESVRYIPTLRNAIAAGTHGNPFDTTTLNRRVLIYEGEGDAKRIKTIVTVKVEDDGSATRRVTDNIFDDEDRLLDRVTVTNMYKKLSDAARDTLIAELSKKSGADRKVNTADDGDDPVYILAELYVNDTNRTYGAPDGKTLSRTIRIYDTDGKLTTSVTVKVDDDGSASRRVVTNVFDADERLVDRITVTQKYKKVDDAARDALIGYLDHISDYPTDASARMIIGTIELAQGYIDYVSDEDADGAEFGDKDGLSLSRSIRIYDEAGKLAKNVNVKVNDDGSATRTVTDNVFDDQERLIDRITVTHKYKKFSDITNEAGTVITTTQQQADALIAYLSVESTTAGIVNGSSAANYVDDAITPAAAAVYGDSDGKTLSRSIRTYETLTIDGEQVEKLTLMVTVRVNDDGSATRTVVKNVFDLEERLVDRITVTHKYDKFSDISGQTAQQQTNALIAYLSVESTTAGTVNGSSAANYVDDAITPAAAAVYGESDGKTLSRSIRIYDAAGKLATSVTVKVNDDGSATRTVVDNVFDVQERLIDRIIVTHKYKKDDAKRDTLIAYLDDLSKYSRDTSLHGAIIGTKAKALEYITSYFTVEGEFGAKEGVSLSRAIRKYDTAGKLVKIVNVKVDDDGSATRTITDNAYDDRDHLVDRTRTEYKYKEIISDTQKNNLITHLSVKSDPSRMVGAVLAEAYVNDSYAAYGAHDTRKVSETIRAYNNIDQLTYTRTENTTSAYRDDNTTTYAISYDYTASTRVYFANGKLERRLNTSEKKDGSITQKEALYFDSGTRDRETTEEINADGTRSLIEKTYAHNGDGKRTGIITTTTEWDVSGGIKSKTTETDEYLYNSDDKLILQLKIYNEWDTSADPPTTLKVINSNPQTVNYNLNGTDVSRTESINEIFVSIQVRSYYATDTDQIESSYSKRFEKIGNLYSPERYVKTEREYNAEGKITRSVTYDQDEDGSLRTVIAYTYDASENRDSVTTTKTKTDNLTATTSTVTTVKNYDDDNRVTTETADYSKPVNADGVRYTETKYTYDDTLIASKEVSYYTDNTKATLLYTDETYNGYDDDDKLSSFNTTRYQVGQDDLEVGYMRKIEDITINSETYSSSVQKMTNIDGSVEFSIRIMNEDNRTLYAQRLGVPPVDPENPNPLPEYDFSQVGVFDDQGHLFVMNLAVDRAFIDQLDQYIATQNEAQVKTAITSAASYDAASYNGTPIVNTEKDEGDTQGYELAKQRSKDEDKNIYTIQEVRYDKNGKVVFQQTSEQDIDTGLETVQSRTETTYYDTGDEGIQNSTAKERKTKVEDGQVVEYVEEVYSEFTERGDITSSVITTYASDAFTILEIKTIAYREDGKVISVVIEAYDTPTGAWTITESGTVEIGDNEYFVIRNEDGGIDGFTDINSDAVGQPTGGDDNIIEPNEDGSYQADTVMLGGREYIVYYDRYNDEDEDGAATLIEANYDTSDLFYSPKSIAIRFDQDEVEALDLDEEILIYQIVRTGTDVSGFKGVTLSDEITIEIGQLPIEEVTLAGVRFLAEYNEGKTEVTLKAMDGSMSDILVTNSDEQIDIVVGGNTYEYMVRTEGSVEGLQIVGFDGISYGAEIDPLQIPQTEGTVELNGINFTVTGWGTSSVILTSTSLLPIHVDGNDPDQTEITVESQRFAIVKGPGNRIDGFRPITEQDINFGPGAIQVTEITLGGLTYLIDYDDDPSTDARVVILTIKDSSRIGDEDIDTVIEIEVEADDIEITTDFTGSPQTYFYDIVWNGDIISSFIGTTFDNEILPEDREAQKTTVTLNDIKWIVYYDDDSRQKATLVEADPADYNDPRFVRVDNADVLRIDVAGKDFWVTRTDDDAIESFAEIEFGPEEIHFRTNTRQETTVRLNTPPSAGAKDFIIVFDDDQKGFYLYEKHPWPIDNVLIISASVDDSEFHFGEGDTAIYYKIERDANRVVTGFKRITTHSPQSPTQETFTRYRINLAGEEFDVYQLDQYNRTMILVQSNPVTGEPVVHNIANGQIGLEIYLGATQPHVYYIFRSDGTEEGRESGEITGFGLMGDVAAPATDTITIQNQDVFVLETSTGTRTYMIDPDTLTARGNSITIISPVTGESKTITNQSRLWEIDGEEYLLTTDGGEDLDGDGWTNEIVSLSRLSPEHEFTTGIFTATGVDVIDLKTNSYMLAHEYFHNGELFDLPPDQMHLISPVTGFDIEIEALDHYKTIDGDLYKVIRNESTGAIEGLALVGDEQTATIGSFSASNVEVLNLASGSYMVVETSSAGGYVRLMGPNGLVAVSSHQERSVEIDGTWYWLRTDGSYAVTGFSVMTDPVSPVFATPPMPPGQDPQGELSLGGHVYTIVRDRRDEWHVVSHDSGEIVTLDDSYHRSVSIDGQVLFAHISDAYGGTITGISVVSDTVISQEAGSFSTTSAPVIYGAGGAAYLYYDSFLSYNPDRVITSSSGTQVELSGFGEFEIDGERFRVASDYDVSLIGQNRASHFGSYMTSSNAPIITIGSKTYLDIGRNRRQASEVLMNSSGDIFLVQPLIVNGKYQAIIEGVPLLTCSYGGNVTGYSTIYDASTTSTGTFTHTSDKVVSINGNRYLFSNGNTFLSGDDVFYSSTGSKAGCSGQLVNIDGVNMLVETRGISWVRTLESLTLLGAEQAKQDYEVTADVVRLSGVDYILDYDDDIARTGFTLVEKDPSDPASPREIRIEAGQTRDYENLLNIKRDDYGAVESIERLSMGSLKSPNASTVTIQECQLADRAFRVTPHSSNSQGITRALLFWINPDDPINDYEVEYVDYDVNTLTLDLINTDTGEDERRMYDILRTATYAIVNLREMTLLDPETPATEDLSIFGIQLAGREFKAIYNDAQTELTLIDVNPEDPLNPYTIIINDDPTHEHYRYI
ncbi:hypothetical protein ACFL0T_02305, partial [Candidatus Omnitrophota bacterium]